MKFNLLVLVIVVLLFGSLFVSGIGVIDFNEKVESVKLDRVYLEPRVEEQFINLFKPKPKKPRTGRGVPSRTGRSGETGRPTVKEEVPPELLPKKERGDLSNPSRKTVLDPDTNRQIEVTPRRWFYVWRERFFENFNTRSDKIPNEVYKKLKSEYDQAVSDWYEALNFGEKRIIEKFQEGIRLTSDETKTFRSSMAKHSEIIPPLIKTWPKHLQREWRDALNIYNRLRIARFSDEKYEKFLARQRELNILRVPRDAIEREIKRTTGSRKELLQEEYDKINNRLKSLPKSDKGRKEKFMVLEEFIEEFNIAYMRKKFSRDYTYSREARRLHDLIRKRRNALKKALSKEDFDKINAELKLYGVNYKETLDDGTEINYLEKRIMFLDELIEKHNVNFVSTKDRLTSKTSSSIESRRVYDSIRRRKDKLRNTLPKEDFDRVLAKINSYNENRNEIVPEGEVKSHLKKRLEILNDVVNNGIEALEKY